MLRLRKCVVWIVLLLVAATGLGCSRAAPRALSQPAFVGTVAAAGSYDESGTGFLILRQPIPGRLWAVREAVCRITPDTLVVVPSYRKSAREVGGPDAVQDALEGHVVAVRGSIGSDSIACTEVSSTAGTPFFLPWEGMNSSYLDREPLIPKPFPSGRSLAASGTLLSVVLLANPAGSVFELASSAPWEFGGKAQKAVTDVQYFLADGSTRKVAGGKTSALSAVDVNPNDAPDSRSATVALVVTDKGVFAREIRYP